MQWKIKESQACVLSKIHTHTLSLSLSLSLTDSVENNGLVEGIERDRGEHTTGKGYCLMI